MNNVDDSNEYITIREDVAYKKRFVAFLDILGFSKIVDNEPTPYKINFYLKDLEKTLRGKPSKIDYILISDSLLIYSTDDSQESFKYITDAVIYIMSLSAINSTPPINDGKEIANFASTIMPFRYRGAVSHGDFYFNEDSKIFFGKALLDAIKWEKKQSWVGAIITPACLDFIRSNEYAVDDYLVEYNVPLKNEGDRKTLCFNWASALPDKFISEKVFYLNEEDKKLKNIYKMTYKFVVHCKHLSE